MGRQTNIWVVRYTDKQRAKQTDRLHSELQFKERDRLIDRRYVDR